MIFMGLKSCCLSLKTHTVKDDKGQCCTMVLMQKNFRALIGVANRAVMRQTQV